jgi:hypothetical protein
MSSDSGRSSERMPADMSIGDRVSSLAQKYNIPGFGK